MKNIMLGQIHIPILKNENLKEEFIAGITSILQGKEIQAPCTHMENVFYNLVHGPTAKVIPGIPQFDPKEIKKSELERYNQIQEGKVPSAGLDHPYKDLNFKPITSLPKEYLEKLYGDCQSRINNQQRTAEYRRFIGYLMEVMKYCANSGEL